MRCFFFDKIIDVYGKIESSDFNIILQSISYLARHVYGHEINDGFLAFALLSLLTISVVLYINHACNCPVDDPSIIKKVQ